MKNFTLLLFIFSFFFTNLFAQKVCSITGSVKDTITHKTIEFVNVAVYSAKTNKIETGCITDSTGSFTIEKLQLGNYYVVISAIGYKSKKISNIELTLKNKFYSCGDVYIDIDLQTLETITIKEDRKLIELKNDRKIINVNSSMAASGASIVDVLEIVPEIKIDMGNITLKNQSFTILLNGKPSGISAEQLNQIPASTIDRIEIITNPSVKYSPQGLGGIVNIITKKNKQGFNAMIQASAGSDNCYNGAGTINYTLKKINFFSTLNGNFYGGQTNGNFDRFSTDGAEVHDILTSNQKFLRYNFKIGFDYNIDSCNFFSFFYSLPNSSGENTHKSISKDINNGIVKHYKSNANYQSTANNNTFSLNFKHLFKQTKAELTLDILQTFNNYSSNYLPFIEYTYPYQTPTKFELTPTENSKTNNIEINYSVPLKSNIKLEWGLNSAINIEKDKNSGSTYNFNKQIWNDSLSIKNEFNSNQYIVGCFILFSKEYKKFNFQLGSRMEYTKINSFLTNSDNNKRNSSYYNLFPNFSMTYTISEQLDLSFSYSRRIERPEPYHLNPFIYASDFLTEKYIGNPNLKPALTNSYELGISQNWEKLSFNANLSYLNTDNAIDRMFYLDNDVRYKTYGNVSDYQTYLFYSSFNWKTTKWLRINISGSFYQDIMQNNSNSIENITKHIGYDLRCNPQLNLKNDFNISGTFIYYGPTYSYSSKIDKTFRINFTLKKTFKDKFIVSLRFNDLLRSKYILNTWDYNFNSITYFDYHYRAMYFGFMYKFGKDIKTRIRTNLNTTEINMQRN